VTLKKILNGLFFYKKNYSLFTEQFEYHQQQQKNKCIAKFVTALCKNGKLNLKKKTDQNWSWQKK